MVADSGRKQAPKYTLFLLRQAQQGPGNQPWRAPQEATLVGRWEQEVYCSALVSCPVTSGGTSVTWGHCVFLC